MTDHTSPHLVEVLLPVNVAHGFDYRVPADMGVAPGSYVTVPFGRRRALGVVWGEGSGERPASACKSITRIHDHLPPMGASMRAFINWAADYTCASLGNVLKLSLSVPDALTAPPLETIYSCPGIPEGLRITRARRTVLEWVTAHPSGSAGDIMENTGAGRSVIDGLVKAGALVKEARAASEPAAPKMHPQKPTLSSVQQQAATYLEAPPAKEFSVTLLEGITGSGKTEVYFERVEEVLAAGKQVLVLLPEIALTVQWVERFKQRFGIPPHIWHSSVPLARRKRTWRAAALGEAQAIVGARSALFLPFDRLGLIVVDEEHDGSYKQEEGVIYHARDMAVARAHHERLPVVLVSATPSLETLVNVEQGKYRHAHLPSRYGEACLPEVALVDMRREDLSASEWLSAPLKEAVCTTLEQGQQSLLFLNRRGYAPLLLCRACGHRFACPACSAWLVLHQKKMIGDWSGGRVDASSPLFQSSTPPIIQSPITNHHPSSFLSCHHCGFTLPAENTCPSCEVEDKLAPCGPGIERLEEEARALFPDARIAVLASDTVQTPEQMQTRIQQIEAGDVDIILGTQMLAKGHHFPSLSLVGIVDADLGLKGGDLRATEHSWQLLHQLAGRAGRAEHAGRVLVQTYQPEHPVMQALEHGDGAALLALEKRARKDAGMPPYGRLAAIILESKQEDMVRNYARALALRAPRVEQVRLLGPAPAPLYRLRHYYRYRLLIKTGRNVHIQRYLQDWLALLPPPSAIKRKIDIDPQSFM